MNNDLISVAKLTELFSKKIDEERKTKLLWILCHCWRSCSGSRSSTLYL